MPRLHKVPFILFLLAVLASCNGSGPAGTDSGSPPSDAIGIPGVQFSPTSITFPAESDQETFTIANVGSAQLDWRVRQITAPWVRVAPTGGSLSPGATTEVAVEVDRSQLSSGNHSAAIGISGPGGMSVLTVRVTDAKTSGPSVALTPTSLSIAATDASGGIEVVNMGSSPLNWTLTGPSWVKLTPASGRLDKGARSRVIVTPDRSKLKEGRNTGMLSLSGNGGSSATATLSVDVAANTAPAPPSLRLTPSSLSFGETTAQLSLEVANDGGQPLDWAVTGPAWASVHPASGQVAAGASAVVVVAPDRSKLSAGSHSGALSFSSNGGSASVAMSVTVPTTSTTSARLRVDPGGLDFGSRGSQRTVTVINEGNATLNWSSQPSWGWISISPASGQVAPGSQATMTVQIDREGLSTGSHKGDIKFTSNGGSAAVSVVARVEVPAALRVSTDTLNFGATANQLSLQIFNDGGQALDWTAASSWGWISQSPTSGRLPAGSSATMTVSVARGGLSGGTHQGTLQVSSTAGTATVTVLATVVSPAKMRMSTTSLDFGASATTLALRIFNDGGSALDWSATSSTSWLTLSALSGRVPAGSSQEVQVQASRSSLATGTHSGSLQFTSNGGSVTVTASVSKTQTTPAPSGSVNVRDFGAVGDGVTNDVAAFDAALSALRVSGGGVLTVPAGVYLLEPATNGALTLGRNQANITIAGEGIDRTILRMAPISYRGATHVILIEKASGISVRDLTLDGNEPSASYNGELQSHGIEIRSTSDVHVERVRFTRLHGDGIRLVGRYQGDEPWTERVLIQDSHFQDCGRSGIGMQRAVRDVRILNNTFEGVNHQSLSSEPTFGGLVDVGVRDIVMEGNVIRHSTKPWAVALEGVSPTDVARRIVFRNNRVENGSVTFRMADDVLIEGNTLFSSLNRPALELPTNVTNIQIIDNDIGGAGGVQGDGVLQVAARYDNQTFPSRITIRNNRIRPRDGTSGILVQDALGEVTIVENEVYGSGNAVGIDIRNPYVKQLPRSGYTIESNTVNNFEWGVRFSTAADPFEEVLIRRNSVDHEQSSPTETVGLIFNKTGAYEAFATVADNLFGAGIKKDIVVR